jgi:outer membrane lipoprotein-sorting protein
MLLALVLAAAPTAEELVRIVDGVLYPETFRAEVEMIAHRPDGSERGYTLVLFKKGRDKTRLAFRAPPAELGREMLRQGENLWMYIPNIKRAVRINARQELMGGDFSNGDVMRLNLVDDYAPSTGPGDEEPDHWVLDLKAKSPEVTYDRVRVKIRKQDRMPVAQELFTASGKKVRTMELTEVQAFGKHSRPARLLMKNDLAAQRWTVMTFKTFEVGVDLPDTRFNLADLGK